MQAIHAADGDQEGRQTHLEVRDHGGLGYAVGGCCDLSTSVHHLVDKLGAELGYLMSKDTGHDVEDCITLATKGLKL